MLLNKTEGFDNRYGNYCDDCEFKNEYGCTQSFNYGYCVDKNGVGKCVSGNYMGPFDPDQKKKCKQWLHRDPATAVAGFGRRVWL